MFRFGQHQCGNNVDLEVGCWENQISLDEPCFPLDMTGGVTVDVHVAATDGVPVPVLFSTIY